MTLEEKILAEIRACSRLDDKGQQDIRTSTAKSIITKHLRALSVEDVADVVGNIMASTLGGEDYEIKIARAILALIRRDV